MSCIPRSSPRCGSTNDRTVHRPNRCILLFHIGSPYSSFYRDCDLLGRRFRTRKLGGSEKCNYMRDRPNGTDIRIA